MIETYGFPYTSSSGDRAYTADDLSAALALFFKSGAVSGYLNSLAPSKVPGESKVSVASGAAIIGGKSKVWESASQISYDDSPTNRIDAVVAQSDTGARTFRLAIIKGTAGAGAPAITDTPTVKNILIAYINIPASGDATVTDMRQYASPRVGVMKDGEAEYVAVVAINDGDTPPDAATLPNGTLLVTRSAT